MTEISPVGGSSGLLRKDPVACVEKVTVVLVSSGMYIDFLQLIVRQNGVPQALAQHGGDGGHLTPFVLADDEYLTGITGWYGWYVYSVTLHTNIRSSQKFGGSGGEREYSIQTGAGEQIVGLCCRSEQYIDAIGAITAPLPYSHAKPEFRVPL